MSKPTPPPATDPFDDFPAFMNTVTTTLDRLTTQAGSLPSKSDLAFHKTLDRGFAKDVEGVSRGVLGLTEQLLELVGSSEGKGQVKGKVGVEKVRRKVQEEEDLVEGYKRFVGDVVDGLLEDADTCIDELNGQKKKGAISVRASLEAKAGQKLPGPLSIQRAPALATSMFNPSTLPKPQLHFPTPVDNSPTPYTHSLPTKPHSLVDLTHIPTLSPLETPIDPLRKIQAIKSLSHPYYYETRHLPYPTSMFITSPPIHPGPMEDTSAIWVDTPEGLEEMVRVLRGEGVKEVAVDLEHHNVRSYHGFTCLIQVSTRVVGDGGEVKGWDWIVDAIKLRGELKEGKFGGVFVDPSVVKVFHGSDSDIPWLQKDFDIHIVNLFDTYHATHVLGKANHSLKALLSEYCNYETDKRLATSDWRIRPLPQEMFDYARSDTHFLLYIYDHLRNALLDKSKSRAGTPIDVDIEATSTPPPLRENPQRAMRDVLAASADTALKVYEREGYDAEFGKGQSGWAGSGRKFLGKGGMEREEGVVWRRIHAWRDGVARELDESPYYVMPTQVMGVISKITLGTVKGIRATVGVVKAPIVHERAEEILEVVKKAREEWRVLKEQEKAGGVSTAGEEGNQEINGDEGMVEHDLKSVVGKLVEEATSGSVIPFTASTSNTLASSNLKPVQSVLAITSTINDIPPVPSKPYDASDLWETVPPPTATTATPSPQTPFAAKPPQTSLFGKTLSTSRSAASLAPTSEAGSSSNGTSSLFGSTLRPTPTPTSKASIAGPSRSHFAAILRGINESIAPPKPVQSVHSEPQSHSDKKTTNALPAVETVPFIPSSSRSTLPAPALPKSPPKEKERDSIVQVKKTKSKGKNKALPSSDTLNGTTLLDIGSPAKKSKKDKEVGGEIAEFDYSKAPNLLDNPHSGVGAGDKKKTKGRSKPTRSGMLDTNFGKVPKDRSQPKQGNKSGTF